MTERNDRVESERKDLVKSELFTLWLSAGVFALFTVVALILVFTADLAVAIAVEATGISTAALLFLVAERFGAMRWELGQARAALTIATQLQDMVDLLTSVDARLATDRAAGEARG